MSSGPVKLKPQHAPKAPHQDPKFLESTAARPIRILAEYLHPLVQLKKEGIGDTIVMFGSALVLAGSSSVPAAAPASWKPPTAALRKPAANPSACRSSCLTSSSLMRTSVPS